MAYQLYKKLMFRLLFLMEIVATLIEFNTDTVRVNFAGNQWLFPMTVGKAVARYNLSYKPPGYYYRHTERLNTVTLEYSSEPDDFINESQPAEVLYGRKVHTYVHAFHWRAGLIDSLRKALEIQYNKKMTIMADKESKLSLKSTKIVMPARLHFGPVSYSLLSVEPSLTIGLREKPRASTTVDRFVEVFLFYNRSDDDVEARMFAF